MENWSVIDWCDYFHSLSGDQMRELATWLASACLRVSEFTDILDRISAQAPDVWRGRGAAFITRYGCPLVESYARRKRRFAELAAAQEAAEMSGALPGDIAGAELRPLPAPQAEPKSVDDVLRMLERARNQW